MQFLLELSYFKAVIIFIYFLLIKFDCFQMFFLITSLFIDFFIIEFFLHPISVQLYLCLIFNLNFIHVFQQDLNK
jgi:hypothetical protein